MNRPGVKLALAAMLLGGAVMARRLPSRVRGDHTPADVRPEDVAQALRPARMDGSHACLVTVFAKGAEETQLGRCATPTEEGAAPIDQAEVDLRYGTFVLRQADLLLGGPMAVPLVRAYTSNDWTSMGVWHAFGRHSNDNFDVAPLGDSHPYTYLDLVLEDGDLVWFPRISGGSEYGNAVYMHMESSSPFYKATIAWNGNGWTLRRADGSEMIFPESYGAETMAQGAATERVDAHGQHLKLERDAARTLMRVAGPQGHWIRFSYDDQARIVRAEDDAGHAVKYVYNGYGMLESATSSDGWARHYEYDGTLMTAIRDDKGRLLVRNRYEKGVLVEQDLATGGRYRFSYQWGPNRKYTESAAVSLPDGHLQTVQTAQDVPEYVRTSW